MDLPDLKKLQKLINFCRKNHINHVKFEQFEFDIAPSGLEIQSGYKKRKAISSDEPIQSDAPKYTDMDVLFWSSAGIPNTQDEVTGA